MKILIVGSRGFIGSACVRYFTRSNRKVVQADIFPALEKDYYQIDANQPNFEHLINATKPDVLINASGSGDVGFSIREPEIDHRLNVTNVALMLDAIHRLRIPVRMINFSSAAIYGNPESLPIIESAIAKPLSPYGKNKLESERILKKYFVDHNVRGISLRVFSAYGAGLKKQLFWDIYQKSLKNKHVELFGTGSESRDFINIDDLVRSIDLIIEKSTFDGGAINLASGREMTIKEASSAFLGYLGSDYKLSFTGEVKKGDPANWRADISKLRQLGFDPFVTFERGIEAYARWLKELR